jgi:hypothetical protein
MLVPTGYSITSEQLQRNVLCEGADILRKSLRNLIGKDYKKVLKFFDFGSKQTAQASHKIAQVFSVTSEAAVKELLGDVRAPATCLICLRLPLETSPAVLLSGSIPGHSGITCQGVFHTTGSADSY